MRAALTWMLLLPACALFQDDGGSVLPPDTDLAPACSNGQVTPSTAALTLQGVQLDGVTAVLGFSSGVSLDGQPAVCLDETYDRARYVVTLEGEPTGFLTVAADADDSTIFLDAPEGGALTLDLIDPFGDGAIFVGPNDWTGGTLRVDDIGERLSFSIAGAVGQASDGTVVRLSGGGTAAP